MKEISLIMMATNGGAKAFKESLGFVIIESESKVLLSCYEQPIRHDPLTF